MEYNTIFKRYDIRGKYPDEISPEVAKKIAKIYFNFYHLSKIIIGHDSIDGANEIYSEISNELAGYGVNVTQIGMVSSPRLYYASAKLNIKYGIMITASHLGAGFTGIKLINDGVPPPEEDLVKLSQIYESKRDISLTSKKGGINFYDINSPYASDVVAFIKSSLTKYKIVIDASNGPNAPVIDKIFSEINIPYTAINMEVKGSGLSHPTNPKIPENRVQLVNAVKESKADLGIIWDGDGDRAYFVDSKGKVIAPEFTASLIAADIKNKLGYKTITSDIRASSAIEQECSKDNIEVVRLKAWHVPIKEEMEKDSKIGFGYEVSGHYVFSDFYKIDDGLLASLVFLRALNNNEKSLSELLKDFRNTYYILEEINFESEKSEEEVVDLLKNTYKDGKVILIDGVTVEYSDWRFNLRSSRTEPILRLNISGISQKTVDENLSKIKSIIKS